MNHDYLERILRELYDGLENKEIFIPIVLCNTIISYKLAFYDTAYWMEFSYWVRNSGIKLYNFEDIKIFFDWFVRQTPQFELVYNDTYHRVIWYEKFLKDFSINSEDSISEHIPFFKFVYYFSIISWDLRHYFMLIRI